MGAALETSIVVSETRAGFAGETFASVVLVAVASDKAVPSETHLGYPFQL
jgi:hypothetical protein